MSVNFDVAWYDDEFEINNLLKSQRIVDLRMSLTKFLWNLSIRNLLSEDPERSQYGEIFVKLPCRPG